MSELEATGEATLLAPEPATTSWHGEENADFIKAKGWENGDAAVKSYRELEKMSSGRVKMPTPESSAEEIRAFYAKTGCPENPEGYESPVVEGAEAFKNEGMEKDLAVIAHEMGVSKQGFEAIVGKYYEAMADQLRVGMETGQTQLKEEFGDKYDENIKIAQRLCGECSEEFQELMTTTGLGNNPVMIKEFLALGKKTLSDTLIKGNTTDGEKGNEYAPAYPNTPEMYASGEDDESVKARAYFVAKGHKY
jgi:hypothetical protein